MFVVVMYISSLVACTATHVLYISTKMQADTCKRPHEPRVHSLPGTSHLDADGVVRVALVSGYPVRGLHHEFTPEHGQPRYAVGLGVDHLVPAHPKPDRP